MNNEIMELIQRRRLQVLVNSCIYYEMNTSIISDELWDKWARELVQLQKDYPEESEQVIWYEAFKDWDASTGAFLPLKDEWVVAKAKQLLGMGSSKVLKKGPRTDLSGVSKIQNNSKPARKPEVKQIKKRRLF